MPYRKNVFIIGAGASVHTGAPLMKDFLQRAEECVDRDFVSPEDANRFRRVLRYRNEHDDVELKAGFDLTNLEHLFGLVELHARVEPGHSSLRDDFVFLILKTLEATVKEEIQHDCQVPVAGERGARVEPRRAALSEHFIDLVAQRWEPPQEETISKHSIISLNYDLVIERAMRARGLRPFYNLGAEPQSEGSVVGVKLLKLHGSANWTVCSNPQCGRVGILPIDEVHFGPMDCSACGSAIQPLVVPPTWSKGEHSAGLAAVWQQAFSELISARRWVIIGVSLAETDLFLKYLFALALKQNTVLDQIWLLDPAEKTGFNTLFESRPKRVQFAHVRNDFQSMLIGGSMQMWLGQTNNAAADPKW